MHCVLYAPHCFIFTRHVMPCCCSLSVHACAGPESIARSLSSSLVLVRVTESVQVRTGSKDWESELTVVT